MLQNNSNVNNKSVWKSEISCNLLLTLLRHQDHIVIAVVSNYNIPLQFKYSTSTEKQPFFLQHFSLMWIGLRLISDYKLHHYNDWEFVVVIGCAANLWRDDEYD